MASHSSTLCLENPMDGGLPMVGCSSWGREESDRTERLHFQFSLSCTEEGNGTPLRTVAWHGIMDGGTWWAMSMGSLRVGHDWVTSLSRFTFMHWRRKWEPTPVFLPAVYGVTQSWTRLKWLSSSSFSVLINSSKQPWFIAVIHSFIQCSKSFQVDIPALICL